LASKNLSKITASAISRVFQTNHEYLLFLESQIAMPQGDLRLHEFAASEVGAEFLAAPQVKTTSIPPLPPQPKLKTIVQKFFALTPKLDYDLGIYLAECPIT
jgi:hypothetical protein